MKIPNQILMNKVYWVNRYFERIDKLFDLTHNQWLIESENNFGSERHKNLTTLKNRIYLKIKILSRYSSLLTNQAITQMNN